MKCKTDVVNKDEMSNSDFIEKVIRPVKQRHS